MWDFSLENFAVFVVDFFILNFMIFDQNYLDLIKDCC